MANEFRIIEGTQFLYADHATDFGAAPATANRSLINGTPTDVQIDLTSLADDAGRESAKVDLGATRALEYSVDAAIEFAATPTSGERVNFYWAPSPNSGTAVGNPANIGGADAAASSGIGTMDELILQCQYIGSLIVSDDATTSVQSGHVGILKPAHRHGILVVVNRSGAAFHSSMDETHIVITPLDTQYQTT